MPGLIYELIYDIKKDRILAYIIDATSFSLYLYINFKIHGVIP